MTPNQKEKNQDKNLEKIAEIKFGKLEKSNEKRTRKVLNSKKKIIFNLTLSLLTIIIYYFITQKDNKLNKSNLEKGKCVLDLGFTLTKKLNKLFLESKKYNLISKILGSLLLDISFIITLINWCFYDKLWSNGLTIIFFYFIRSIIQNLNRMKIPYEEGYEWKNPYFPSITVNYFKSNDFFWSGHVGICIICLFYAKIRKQIFFSFFYFFVALIEAKLVLESRTHYTIDVPIGIFFAHYSCLIVDFWCRTFKFIEFKNLVLRKKNNLYVSEIDLNDGSKV
jgi:hypothetical protein